MSLLQSNSKVTTTSTGFYDFPIGQSLRFDGSSYLQKNNFGTSAGTVNTFSWWMKLSDLSDTRITIFGAYYNTADFDLGIGATGYGAANTLRSNWGGGANYNLHYINNKLRDTSAWYHIVVSFNSSNSSGNKVKKYINGTPITVTTSADPSYTSFGRNSSTSRIGARVDGPGFVVGQQFKGYLAEINFIDGSALTPTSFGETKNGVWIPKAYTGSYGTNGFRLTFENGIETIGGVANQIRDESSNSNHWTKN